FITVAAVALSFHDVAATFARTTIRIDAATGALFVVYVMIGAFLSFALFLAFKILKDTLSGIRCLYRRSLSKPIELSTQAAAEADKDIRDSAGAMDKAPATVESCAVYCDTPKKQDKTTVTFGSVLFRLASLFRFVLYFTFKILKESAVFCVWHLPCFFLGLLRRRPARPAPELVDGRHATHIATTASESCTANANTATKKKAKSAITRDLVGSVFVWMTLAFGTLISIAAIALNSKNATQIDIATTTTLMAYVLTAAFTRTLIFVAVFDLKAENVGPDHPRATTRIDTATAAFATAYVLIGSFIG
ncbi:hypothetical protein HDU96_003448, partial [Phlyctochytrium bullatum]